MTRKRFKKLLMAKRVQRNEANWYVETTPSTERQETLNGIYIISKSHSFTIGADWFVAVEHPGEAIADLVTKRMEELLDDRKRT